MNKKIVFCFVCVSLLLSSCLFIVNENEVKESIQKEFLQAEKKVVGTYHGTLPCASCAGIDTWITISAQKGGGLCFTMTETYMEEKDGIFTARGKGELVANNTIIKLQGDGDTAYFRIGEKSITRISFDNEKKSYSKSDPLYLLSKMPEKMADTIQ